jgi:hypothetical protein
MWTRGLERWSLEYIIFVEIVKTFLKLYFYAISLDFNPISTIFEFLKRFRTLSIYWLVKSYDFTSQLAILTTLSTIVYIYILCKKFIDEMDCEHEATFIWVLIIWVECGWIAIMFVDFKMWDKFWIGSCAVETLDTLIIC